MQYAAVLYGPKLMHYAVVLYLPLMTMLKFSSEENAEARNGCLSYDDLYAVPEGSSGLAFPTVLDLLDIDHPIISTNKQVFFCAMFPASF
jgi:hypothetical protein